MTLGKDVFVALAALAWVDGEVAPEEAEALMGAAMMTGLSESDLTEAEAALGVPVCTPKGMIFVSENCRSRNKSDVRFCFCFYVDFTQPTVNSTLVAPVMLRDGSVRCI